MKIIVAHTGASGSIYCVKFLKWLTIRRNIKVLFTASEEGFKILEDETKVGRTELKKYVSQIYNNDDLRSDISSGTAGVDAMVIVPASMNTVAKIAGGIADNLITRAASNILKLKRKLIVVAREMPLSTIHLENLTKLSQAGADVMLASPPFYHNPKTIDEIALPVIYYINELLGIENNINFKWQGSAAEKNNNSD
jgi:4-hydroxy-3-polyprenylbenzoate decarboxylase